MRKQAKSKKFFFEPCMAARFRFRGVAATPSGRKNQKTFVPLRAVLKQPGTEINKVFLPPGGPVLFVHKKKFFSFLDLPGQFRKALLKEVPHGLRAQR